MKRKVLKGIGILVLAAFLGGQAGMGTVQATGGQILEESAEPGAALEGGETEAGDAEAPEAPESGEAAPGDGEAGKPEEDAVGGGEPAPGDDGGEESSSGDTESGSDVSGGGSEEPAHGTPEGGDSGQTGTETPAEKTKLATPEISWSDWMPSWPAVEGANGWYGYEAQISRDGGESWETFIYHESSQMGESLVVRDSSLRMHIDVKADDDKAVFRFRARALDEYDSERYESSDWSDWSEVKEYTRPEQRLGTTECWWDEEVPGLIHWSKVEGASGYMAELYKDSSDSAISWSGQYDPDKIEIDFSHRIDFYGEGKYYVRVWALSGDINTCANGFLGNASDIYDTTTTVSTVSDAVQKALEEAGGDAAKAAAAIAGKANPSEIAMAMQTDAKVLEQIRELEKLYAEQKGITVASPAVTEAAGAMIDSSKISVAGAALNAADSSSITLQVDVAKPENMVDMLSNKYAKSVQLDISLINGDASVHELKVPMTITMPIPAGLDAKKLTVVHYSQDGKGEEVSFRINGDGTVTFTVTHFSTFLFGEKKDEGVTIPNENQGNGGHIVDNVISGNGGNTGNNGNGGNNEQGAQDDAQPQAAAAPNVSPRTGQEPFEGFSIWALAAFAISGAVCLLAVGCRAWRKKRM